MKFITKNSTHWVLLILSFILLCSISCKSIKSIDNTNSTKKDSIVYITSTITKDTLIYIPGDSQTIYIPVHDTVFISKGKGGSTAIVNVKSGKSTIEIQCPDKDLLIEKQKVLIDTYKKQVQDSTKYDYKEVPVKYIPKAFLYSSWILWIGLALFTTYKVAKSKLFI